MIAPAEYDRTNGTRSGSPYPPVCHRIGPSRKLRTQLSPASVVLMRTRRCPRLSCRLRARQQPIQRTQRLSGAVLPKRFSGASPTRAQQGFGGGKPRAAPQARAWAPRLRRLSRSTAWGMGLTLGHSSGTSKVAVPRSSCSASGEKAAGVASSLLRRSVWRDVLRL